MPHKTVQILPGETYRLGIYRLKLLANSHGRL